MNITEIYMAQEFISEGIVAEKIKAGDFEVFVSMIADDDILVPILVDGHHSLYAAIRSGNTPNINVVDSEYATVEDFVVACGERSNPETVEGVSLW